ncbi:baseplate J/gp47 family protein [Companilactobacillus nantensis]|uniref:Baseplate J-like protein n=1 Tax=Companilactobacillus nantensis DSM 16982 TaxID=1423774 RepID=A0A0R1WSS5_9LACO|nr:baseplate J/gp47 family protein [Companilactobacillus nantensis]KRM17500.1 baseplate J-like protein [Companilactobacillus nantensis DSM 16982]GEO64475.1 phage tail protein [Companilactobacillus nantensis]
MTPEDLSNKIEKQNFDFYLSQMMKNVPDDIDKRQGAIIYDALAPAAMVMAQQSLSLSNVVKESYIKTADNEFLDYRAIEHGTSRQLATATQVKAKFLDSKGNTIDNIDVGDRFASLGDTPIFYKVIKINADLTGMLEAEEVGTRPNGYFGQILPVTPNDILSWAEIVEVSIPSKDNETDEHLRNRLLSTDSWIAYGGNIADYLDMLSKIDSVGSAQVYPVWNGGGTVKLVILDNDLMPASETLLKQVKETIDPVDAESEGYGLAPIDHNVKVVAPEPITIDISTKVDVDTQADIETLKPKILSAIEDYFKLRRIAWSQINKATGRGYTLTIYRSQILSAIMKVDGVVNASIPTLNGIDDDIALTFNNDLSQLPVLGEVNLNG